MIPFELGRKLALFSGETTLLANEAARETARERSASEREYKDKNWKYFYSARKNARSRREEMKYVIAKAMACRLSGRNPYDFLRGWQERDGGVAARLIVEREGYSGIGCIYYENYYIGEWYKIEHFAPQMDYPNRCAVDFSPGKPGKEALDVLRRSDNARSYMDSANRREDVVARKKLLQERWSYFSRERTEAARTWGTLDAVSRWYLLMRACDWVMYGKEFANRSFPDPSNNDYSLVVTSLVWLFEEHEAELVKKLEDAEETRERERIDRHCAESVVDIVVSPPARLEPRVLDAAQIRTVRNACIEDIKNGPQVVHEVAGTIDEFAKFCGLLARPENHILVPSGQYIEKQVPLRQESDMVNEMARVLTGLPRHIAYARIVEEKGGEPIVWKGRIRTEKLPDAPAEGADAARSAIEKNALRYCRGRQEIEQEIKGRQEKWRVRVWAEAPSVHIQAKKPELPSGPGASEPDEPPPTSVSVKKAGGKPEEYKKQTAEAPRASRDAGILESFTVQRPASRATDGSPKERSVYRSDFNVQTGWGEECSEDKRGFILDGYFHNACYRADSISYFYPPIIVDDFKTQVDVELNIQSGENADCGVVFCLRENNGKRLFYNFTISPSGGGYRLYCKTHEKPRVIIDWTKSSLVKRGDNVNSLMVQRIGQQVSLGINGQIVATAMDEGLTCGNVGLFVTTYTTDLYAEARFRNFLIYAVDK